MTENLVKPVHSSQHSNVKEVDSFLKKKKSLSIQYNKDLNEKKAEFARVSKGRFKIDMEIKSEPLGTGIKFSSILKKKNKGKVYSLQKVVSFSNEEISDLEVESAVDFNLGIGNIVFKNGMSYYGFIDGTNKPYLLGIFTESTGEKFVKLDYGLEYGLDDAWVVTNKNLDEIIQFLSEQCEKGFLSQMVFNFFITLDYEIDGEYVSKYNDSYLTDAIVKPVTSNDFFQSFEVSLSDASSLKFNITDKQNRLVYSDITLDKLLKLEAVVAPYYSKYGKLIYDLEDLAEEFSAKYYPENLVRLLAALNLPETAQIYIDRLNDLNQAKFYLKKDNFTDLEDLIDLTFEYCLCSTSGRTGYRFKKKNEFFNVLDQAKRWVSYYMDLELKYQGRYYNVLTVFRNEVRTSASKIFN